MGGAKTRDERNEGWGERRQGMRLVRSRGRGGSDKGVWEDNKRREKEEDEG